MSAKKKEKNVGSHVGQNVMGNASIKRIVLPIAVSVAMILLAAAAVAANVFSPARAVTSSSVEDSRGRLLGSVIDVSGDATKVAVRFGITPVVLEARQDSLRPSDNTWLANLFFESTDCTGPAYAFDMGAYANSLWPAVVMLGPGIYLYTGDVREVAFGSVLAGGESSASPVVCLDPSSSGFSSPNNLRPVAQAGDLNDFRAPFRLRLNERD